MKLSGANGKSILLVVNPNSSKATRFVLISEPLADAFGQWLRHAGHPFLRTTTVFRALAKPIDEQARCFKLLMDFRRAGGAPFNQGAVQ